MRIAQAAIGAGIAAVLVLGGPASGSTGAARCTGRVHVTAASQMAGLAAQARNAVLGEVLDLAGEVTARVRQLEQI